MPRHAIFWPVLSLVLWTFLVLVQVPIRRFHAAFKGRVVASDFRYGESGHVPADVALPNRVFMNLVEVPTLFYVLCLILYVTGTVTPACVALAWLYFALRIAHSLIYLTYNHVVHRFAVFATSNLVVLAILICLAVRLSA
ncbi:MAPEG family protein [Rhizobacter sp. AJA081-3]|uniref:MAPEG family protein n=1 Tax=Rhizobacter sp. AJA081-3 TaxID=2753607 RepID=UPI001ADF9337|nr:MAPEG family protein [Rhizobacter sp. AJA081-3]QTN21581.1 MAPEG family protein [Rhizobacter sp. AJA081-3]